MGREQGGGRRGEGREERGKERGRRRTKTGKDGECEERERKWREGKVNARGEEKTVGECEEEGGEE